MKKVDPKKMVWVSYLGTMGNVGLRGIGDVVEIQAEQEGVAVTRVVTQFAMQACGFRSTADSSFTWNNGVPSYHGSPDAPQAVDVSSAERFDLSSVICIRISFVDLEDLDAINAHSAESALIGLIAPSCLNATLGDNRHLIPHSFRWEEFLPGKAPSIIRPAAREDKQQFVHVKLVAPRSKRFKRSFVGWLTIPPNWL